MPFIINTQCVCTVPDFHTQTSSDIMMYLLPSSGDNRKLNANAKLMDESALFT